VHIADDGLVADPREKTKRVSEGVEVSARSPRTRGWHAINLRIYGLPVQEDVVTMNAAAKCRHMVEQRNFSSNSE